MMTLYASIINAAEIGLVIRISELHILSTFCVIASACGTWLTASFLRTNKNRHLENEQDGDSIKKQRYSLLSNTNTLRRVPPRPTLPPLCAVSLSHVGNCFSVSAKSRKTNFPNGGQSSILFYSGPHSYTSEGFPIGVVVLGTKTQDGHSVSVTAPLPPQKHPQPFFC